MIVSSVLSKVSFPTLHAAAAIIKLCETEWYGSVSYFVTAMINKKYALPKRAIDALVKHFASFREDDRDLPVLWHQSLLCFAQRYKFELTDVQKQKLKFVMKQHCHPQITPEIRRELFMQA